MKTRIRSLICISGFVAAQQAIAGSGCETATQASIRTRLARGLVAEAATSKLVVEGQPPQSRIERTSFQRQLTGDLLATVSGQRLYTGTESVAAGGFVSLQFVEATLGNRTGTFVLQQTATFEENVFSMNTIVVPGSGTGGLAGLAGSMKLINSDGPWRYEFCYALP